MKVGVIGLRLFDGAESLELVMQGMAGRSVLHPVLLWGREGSTLIDTGIPGTGDALLSALAGRGVSTLDHVILTHQDIDHIGNLPVVTQGGAKVFAHSADTPAIEGREPLLKMGPERLQAMLAQAPKAQRSQMEALFNGAHAPVDRQLQDGEELPFHGGIRVIHTPGHTPGHLCLYLPAHRLLLAGDAMRVVDGELVGPAPAVTPDMPQAIVSLRKLVGLELDKVLCYHGGLFEGNAVQAIRRLVQSA